ncbi:hypothetical protein [Lewinella sp. 4G2]|uniref:hypothetical protein n=1 Tax=Lewinella sp. 4G2 TaxID=1803372 RepID=UPI0007B47AA7|nr:hypothetical protein [Lewinella sp. 4G2]OAV43902.1 hypothetical protein A3850_005075 [Lewinella sp. 4G2]
MTRLFSLIVLLLISCTAFAGAPNKGPKGGNSLFERWAGQETLSVELHINLDSLEVYRRKTESLPATLVTDGQELELDVAVRGRFRRRACAMPPLKLQFAKDGLRALGLNTHNDFKLVTHCTDDEAGRDAILREQLAYELYNTINPKASFRTRLLEVTYVNTVDGSKTTNAAIIIEDFDELKDRLNMSNCKDCYNVKADSVANAEMVTLFQYMIGNADFCHRMLRNTKMLKAENGQYTAVPYDFDFSGFVNANYATPDPTHGQIRITDRVLLWSFDDSGDFDAAVERFQGLETTFLTQIDEFDGLKNGSKRELRKFIKDFYKDLQTDAFRTAGE